MVTFSDNYSDAIIDTWSIGNGRNLILIPNEEDLIDLVQIELKAYGYNYVIHDSIFNSGFFDSLQKGDLMVLLVTQLTMFCKDIKHICNRYHYRVLEPNSK